MDHRLPERDKPWMMRTYAGHSTAAKSNELYRSNLSKGQTGLSIAFDLPTQTGYDPDDELARGEVGKVGVPVAHKGDMETLLGGIPLDRMNTSMTINATAAWLLALYIVTAEAEGVSQEQLSGTTQNDIIKEFLARGTYAFPPEPSMRLIADMIAYTVEQVPRWNPINICSYHLQEAGATPVQEIAFAMSNAIAVLDAARERVPADRLTAVFGRISFFVNAGVRFVEEHAKLRAMGVLWEELGRERYGVTDEKALRLRYGVQVNSLGLTESQPENNVQRIVLEALAVTLGRNARARAVQLPAWNEALGLPRPWDQQWSLRIQQVLALETDLLEYPDIFEGSKVMDGLVAEMLEGARAEMAVVAEHGGAVKGVDYMKAALVDSHRERLRRIESGEQIVVGINRYTESEPSPLMEGVDGGILTVDADVEAQQRESVERWRAGRDQAAVDAALAEVARVARSEDENIMPATIAAARAGVTTGEWSRALREAFGEYRAPTGVGEAASPVGPGEDQLAALRDEVERISEALGRRIKILVGKPGLDGHSNGAEQIAVRARDAGMDVVYEGIRLTPQQIAASALQEGVHVVGLSILSGSHRELIPSVMDALRERGVDVPVVVGGIIPDADVELLKASGLRPSTPRRTSTSRGSCRTSSGSSPSAAGSRRRRRPGERVAPLTPRLFGERGKRRAEKLGIDPERLPPGQSPTQKFPVLSIGPTPKLDTATWSLSVHGLVDEPFALRWDELLALEQTELTTDLHCVTRWSKFDTRWTGVRVSDLLARARPRATATHVLVHAHGGYTTNLPLAALAGADVLVAHTFDGRPLEPEHGGPARLLVPQRYLWKSAKWVSAIELLDHDEPGLWERNGYHNDGDPWREERHTGDQWSVRQVQRRLRGQDPA